MYLSKNIYKEESQSELIIDAKSESVKSEIRIYTKKTKTQFDKIGS